MMTYLIIGATILIWGTAFVFAYWAVLSARTPQGSVAWVIFLLASPVLAIPAYLFLGNFRFKGYLVSRRDTREVVEGVAQFAASHMPLGDDDDVGYTAFEKIAEVPVLSGNGMKLLIDGQETFDAIFAEMDKAEDYILVQFYILKDDELGREFQQKLIDCAQRGVTVHLLFDAVGSAKLPKRYLEELEESGVKTVNAHDLQGPRNRFQINFRNHRKTVIVDGRVGFTGGLNVGDEYMGRDPHFGHWRDTHCRIEGPIVLQLQLVFVEDWHWATQDNVIPNLNWQGHRSPEDMDALIMATGPADEMETGSLYFCAAIAAARKRLWIATPYLIPDGDILSALKLAALRGVDVRIMIPEKADHYVTWLAAFAYFDELKQAGVKILMYANGFTHQKVLLVDESIASIGTTNLDNRSCRLNFEATAIFFDKRAAQDVAAMLEKDFTECKEVEKSFKDLPRLQRMGAPVARLFAPIL
ncbi:cardiolipin synthase [Falsihalocynthiibacter sp. SS001]|uniref:cardiolipin synthase n=1 Tax=Falsihalocynthiibacter sp. SS001 TaxID=3349698 RepID=UPI0036D3699B